MPFEAIPTNRVASSRKQFARLRRLGVTILTLAGVLSSAPASADPPAPPPQVGTSPALEPGQHFVVDPVVDGVLIAGGAGFSGLLSLVLGTGEIRATPPGPTSSLLSLDRGAVTQHLDPNASMYSNVGLYTAVAFAALDPLLSGLRDGWDAGLVDVLLYAETLSLTETLTDITKIAVRRPRPIDYINCPAGPGGTPNGACGSSTDLQLSFFSGHAATVASIGATATYLAFVRDPGSLRPWITLGAASALTTFVSYERVRSGAHFPTDVIAGSMAGAAVGVLVPHLHRHQQEAPPVWVGAAPAPGGGSLTLGGSF
jgi:undecaprenyl-diphosphatase